MSEHKESPVLTPEQLAGFAASWNASAMLQWLGFRMEFPGHCVRVSIDKVQPGHRGGKGTSAVNGGALAALYDFTIGSVPVITTRPPLRRSATAQLSISFERAVRGEKVICEAVIDRATKNLVYASAKIMDEQGNVCSRATGLVSLGDAIDYESWRDTLNEATTTPPRQERP